MSAALPYSLELTRLQAAYDAAELTPSRVVGDVLASIAATQEGNPAWIYVMPQEALLRRAAALEARRAEGERLPLYGVPFAVKDNIDVEGHPTTAACPDFSYVAKETAHAVERLERAGAVLIGKTNMDQFATGLVGTRSPYGVCLNPFDARYVSGGSSSGSAVAVALGHVSFALGTDTAGSGRVPAGFCNIVGLKPTRGLISAHGVVPACRSLDCVSIFALTTEDAAAVLDVARGYDPADPYSRDSDAGISTGTSFPRQRTSRTDARGACDPARESRASNTERLRFGVPRVADLKFFGDQAAQRAFEHALNTLRTLGAELVEFDYTPFAEVARLLYEGPWVAERLAAIRPFFDASSQRMHPVVRDIIAKGAKYSAVDAFEGQYELGRLAQRCAETWKAVDMLVVPTAGTIYRVEDVLADPVALNTNLGYYTNFVNLLDLAAIAVPAGFREDGPPFGITLISPAFEEAALAQWAARFHRATSQRLGATSYALPQAPTPGPATNANAVTVAVVGAHLSGMPLNHQLTSRGARLLETCSTAACYRLYALRDTQPPKPGLARAVDGSGVSVEVELWNLPFEAFGSFVAEVPPPLAIGTLVLADGREVKGFLCEAYALEGARDISAFGGWRRFIATERAA